MLTFFASFLCFLCLAAEAFSILCRRRTGVRFERETTLSHYLLDQERRHNTYKASPLLCLIGPKESDRKKLEMSEYVGYKILECRCAVLTVYVFRSMKQM